MTLKPPVPHIAIGFWHEREPRERTECPSYYAADYETLRTFPGDFEVHLTFAHGYTVPMPRLQPIRIDAERIAGRVYSGFCGVNFASEPLPLGERVVYLQGIDTVDLPVLITRGIVTLQPQFEWLVASPTPWNQPSAPQTWEAVHDLYRAYRSSSTCLASQAGAASLPNPQVSPTPEFSSSPAHS